MTNYINESPEDKLDSYNQFNNGFMTYNPTTPTDYMNQSSNDENKWLPQLNTDSFKNINTQLITNSTNKVESLVKEPVIDNDDNQDVNIINLPNKVPTPFKRLNIPKNKITDMIDKLDVSDSDKDYLKTLGQRESEFNPNSSVTVKGNTYRGLYQFGNGALSQIGMKPGDYDGNIENQFQAALKFGRMNILPYRSLIGKTINGVNITENGLMAAAHLGGPGGLKALLNKGEIRKDKFGTSTLDYMKLFDK